MAKCREPGWALTSPKTGEPIEPFWLPNKVVCIQVMEWMEGKRRGRQQERRQQQRGAVALGAVEEPN